LILNKISKIGATRRQILRLKCTKIDFQIQYPPDPIRGTTSKGKEGKRKERRKGKEKGRGREGRKGENDLTHPVSNSWLRHCTGPRL